MTRCQSGLTSGSKAAASSADPAASKAAADVDIERYKYILQQLQASNENVHRFLAIYQTLATGLVTAMLALFIGHHKWSLSPETARTGLVGLMILLTVIAAFTTLLVAAGVLTWMDYRREECELTDLIVREGYRKPPQWKNFYRWYETYVVMFIAAATIAAWVGTYVILLPNMS